MRDARNRWLIFTIALCLSVGPMSGGLGAQSGRQFIANWGLANQLCSGVEIQTVFDEVPIWTTRILYRGDSFHATHTKLTFTRKWDLDGRLRNDGSLASLSIRFWEDSLRPISTQTDYAFAEDGWVTQTTKHGTMAAQPPKRDSLGRNAAQLLGPAPLFLDLLTRRLQHDDSDRLEFALPLYDQGTLVLGGLIARRVGTDTIAVHTPSADYVIRNYAGGGLSGVRLPDGATIRRTNCFAQAQ